jgi:hypothetical protein
MYNLKPKVIDGTKVDKNIIKVAFASDLLAKLPYPTKGAIMPKDKRKSLEKKGKMR